MFNMAVLKTIVHISYISSIIYLRCDSYLGHPRNCLRQRRDAPHMTVRTVACARVLCERTHNRRNMAPPRKLFHILTYTLTHTYRQTHSHTHTNTLARAYIDNIITYIRRACNIRYNNDSACPCGSSYLSVYAAAWVCVRVCVLTLRDSLSVCVRARATLHKSISYSARAGEHHNIRTRSRLRACSLVDGAFSLCIGALSLSAQHNSAALQSVRGERENESQSERKRELVRKAPGRRGTCACACAQGEACVSHLH